MSQIQADIDALLAQATALAEEASTPSAPPPAAGPARQAKPDGPAPRPEPEDPARILRLSVPVIVRLAERTMPLDDIINLSTGAIIEFDKPAEAELDLMINNKCIGRGQAVKVGENFGLRITTIGSVRERIEALGPRRSLDARRTPGR